MDLHLFLHVLSVLLLVHVVLIVNLQVNLLVNIIYVLSEEKLALSVLSNAAQELVLIVEDSAGFEWFFGGHFVCFRN